MIATLAALSACNDETGFRPGLWTQDDIIETFPGDTIVLQGQVSNYIGMKSIEIKCEAWDVYKKIELDGKHSKVYNMNQAIVVPMYATFDQVLMVTVTDTEGTENKKAITLTFKPDAYAPTIVTPLPDEVAVDFNTTKGKAVYEMELLVTDDRSLKSAVVEIPGIGYSREFSLSGREDIISDSPEFTTTGQYAMHITLEDTGGNQLLRDVTLVVIMPETENPFEDYAQMYVVDASENPDDYVSGYYRYMDRKDPYQYSCKIYVPYDNYQVFFTPTESLSGDLFGVSPMVSSKLMNNNGYVVPVTLEKKGYYWLWIDIQNHEFSVTPYEVESEIYTGALYVTGTGFSTMGDWSFSPAMSNGPTNYRKQITLELNPSYSADYTYGITDGTWNRVWRCGENKWWWLDDQGWGGSVYTFKPGGAKKVVVTFDTAELWSTIKKVK